jgi:hypothetical protein
MNAVAKRLAPNEAIEYCADYQFSIEKSHLLTRIFTKKNLHGNVKYVPKPPFTPNLPPFTTDCLYDVVAPLDYAIMLNNRLVEELS